MSQKSIKMNFGAGPSVLPKVVLDRVSRELRNFQGTGASIVEIGHITPEYKLIHFRAMALLKDLMEIPDSHQVVFMQGGTRCHYSFVPLNFIREGQSADYLITGHWGQMAYNEASVLKNVRVAGDSVGADGNHVRIPKMEELELSPEARYVHFCSNNTIAGTQWHEFPETGDVPLIADMTSDILSRKFDWSKLGMAYFGAQKNLGPSGVVIAVIRRDLLKDDFSKVPPSIQYANHAKRDSLFYTPTTFSVLAMQLVLEHALELGGVDALERASKKKSNLVYTALEKYPEIYKLFCDTDSRSLMNVTFKMHKDGDLRRFLAESERRGMHGLRGHRVQGGIRVSLYNWLPIEHVEELVGLIDDFASSTSGLSGRHRPVSQRRSLLLKVEYQLDGVYHAEYVHNISMGGLLLSGEIEVGTRLVLRLSFLGFLAPLSLVAQVRWSEAESDEGPAQSGLEFVALNETADEWLSSLLGGTFSNDDRMKRIVMVESNSFLSGVYEKELKKQAAEDKSMVDLVVTDDSAKMMTILKKRPAELVIIDVDEQELDGRQILDAVRAEFGPALPVVMLGGPPAIEKVYEVLDPSLMVLKKPLNFGQLMQTVRVLFSS